MPKTAMIALRQRLQTALQFAMAHQPAVGGFPFLAECLRQAGVIANKWSLPSAQSIYLMEDGAVVQQGKPLIEGLSTVFAFDETALILALRKDQAGQSSFPEFLLAAWQAGVVSYEVNFLDRTVVYCGVRGESYTETYPMVVVQGLHF